MIKLPVFVVDILKRHKAHQEKQRREVGSAWIEKDLVFTNAQGYFYSSSTLRKVFRRFLVSKGSLPERVEPPSAFMAYGQHTSYDAKQAENDSSRYQVRVSNL